MSTPAATQTKRWQDVSAGLSIAGLLLPEAVAYASIGNLAPQAGILALFAGLLCYGVLGTSRFAIVSATSSSAAVLAAAMASMPGGTAGHRLMLMAGLVMLTGGFFLLAWVARLGSVTQFIAKPVLRGFSFGLAIVIIVKQLPGVLGVQPPQGDVLHLVPGLLARAGQWNGRGAALCAAALLLLFLLRRAQRWPAGLIVIALGIGAGRWLDLPGHGVALVGAIDVSLAMPVLPRLTQAEWTRLAELAFALALILYAESYGAIRSFALKHGDPVAPERDLLALGMANVLAGLLQAMPVGAGYSATSANEAAGATSRLAGLVAAAVVGVIVLTLLPLVALTPVPVLAAVVIHAVSHTLNPVSLQPYFAWRRDRLLVLAAIAGVLLFGVLDGLLVAIAISLLLMLRRLSRPGMSVLGRLGESHDYVKLALHRNARAQPELLILRLDEPLFFVNAERSLHLARALVEERAGPLRKVILSLEESPDLDGSSVEALRDFAAFVRQQRLSLALARLKEPAYMVLQLALGDLLAVQAGPALLLSELSVAEAVRLLDAAAPEK
ncbi:SulP family inorganic anion transporter [Janthinobacterium sp. GW458P]|uniref:SulP family inorganic anion transporter n=1 Tax=Janthinobacterium sp. GW458P TaxID=1981504 RepID=UPI000A3247E8|nr:SulP family inorganic anion transporter [Janthinobacterium sp. GW458P]MBE3024402.1 SulP family inorganic anion transporter [Janthinobacterium sp. GW458P]PHV15176.1 SulP family inorganic anion transporter [Janthinobacterium sp. BJB303]